MNEDDLDMIRNEELINPLYGELPDLDDESETSPEITTEMWKQETNKQDLDMNNNELMRPEIAELEDLDDTGTEKMKQNTEDRKPELATPPKEEKKQTKEKTYAGGLTANELGIAAARYDKQNGGGDMYKNVVLGQLGTDASERNKFNAAYNEEKKRK